MKLFYLKDKELLNSAKVGNDKALVSNAGQKIRKYVHIVNEIIIIITWWRAICSPCKLLVGAGYLPRWSPSQILANNYITSYVVGYHLSHEIYAGSHVYL